MEKKLENGAADTPKITSVKPPRGCFICRVKIAEPSSDAGIIFPEGVDSAKFTKYYKEHPVQGTVLYVGDGFNDYPMQVKEGDRVLIRMGTGSDVIINKQYLSLYRESDLLAIVQYDE